VIKTNRVWENEVGQYESGPAQFSVTGLGVTLSGVFGIRTKCAIQCSVAQL